MPADPLDDDGYPTPETTGRVASWPADDIEGLLRFLYSIWWNADWCWSQRGRWIYISTAGWSGNEELIGAMGYTAFWMMCWESHRRGGHYKFRVPAHLVSPMPVIVPRPTEAELRAAVDLLNHRGEANAE